MCNCVWTRVPTSYNQTTVQGIPMRTTMRGTLGVTFVFLALTALTSAQNNSGVFKAEAASAFIWGEENCSDAISSSTRDPVTGDEIRKLNHGGIEVSSRAGFERIGWGEAGEFLIFAEHAVLFEWLSCQRRLFLLQPFQGFHGSSSNGVDGFIYHQRPSLLFGFVLNRRLLPKRNNAVLCDGQHNRLRIYLAGSCDGQLRCLKWRLARPTKQLKHSLEITVDCT